MKELSAPQHTVPAKPLELGVPIALFEAATVRGSQIVAPGRRLAVAGYPTAATLRAVAWCEDLDNGTRHSYGEPVDDFFFGSNGDQYVRRHIHPFNKGLPVDAYPGPDQPLGVVRIGVDWDDDTSRTYGVEEEVRTQLGIDEYRTPIEDYPVEYYDMIEQRISELDLQFADRTRAAIQPIVVQLGGMTLASLPDEENWIMQQGEASQASYEHFMAHPDIMQQYYDKFNSSAPDMDGFVGATLVVPMDLFRLRLATLAFVEPVDVQEILNVESLRQIAG